MGSIMNKNQTWQVTFLCAVSSSIPEPSERLHPNHVTRNYIYSARSISQCLNLAFLITKFDNYKYLTWVSRVYSSLPFPVPYLSSDHNAYLNVDYDLLQKCFVFYSTGFASLFFFLSCEQDKIIDRLNLYNPDYSHNSRFSIFLQTKGERVGGEYVIKITKSTDAYWRQNGQDTVYV